MYADDKYVETLMKYLASLIISIICFSCQSTFLSLRFLSLRCPICIVLPISIPRQRRRSQEQTRKATTASHRHHPAQTQESSLPRKENGQWEAWSCEGQVKIVPGGLPERGCPAQARSPWGRRAGRATAAAAPLPAQCAPRPPFPTSNGGTRKWTGKKGGKQGRQATAAIRWEPSVSMAPDRHESCRSKLNLPSQSEPDVDDGQKRFLPGLRRRKQSMALN